MNTKVKQTQHKNTKQQVTCKFDIGIKTPKPFGRCYINLFAILHLSSKKIDTPRNLLSLESFARKQNNFVFNEQSHHEKGIRQELHINEYFSVYIKQFCKQ